MSAEEAQVNLFWTGGWDSTFRLLTLVLLQQKRVQPYYVVDTKRKSTLIELRTMSTIKEYITQRRPELTSLVKPTIIVSIHDIEPDAAVTAKLERLRKKAYLGKQYDWLVRFANQRGLKNVELCAVAYGNVYKYLQERVKQVNDGWKVQTAEDDDLSVFSNLSFPLLFLSKSEMEQISIKNGFHDIMMKTWFCHQPWRGKPCGVCTTCSSTIKEGFARRLPRISLLRRKVYMPLFAINEGVFKRKKKN